ncbi:MAG: AMP-binding protein, partial [Halobacteriales archaeon]|nr:AMP-binding protein [Halobacteriales archaeon]
MPGGSNQTLRPFLWRSERLYPDTEIVSRTGTGIERYDYATYGERARQLADSLTGAGIDTGDRIGTFCWNHHRHFETYFGVPCMGAQLHTINPLLPDEHIQYIVENANDRILFVDPSLLDKLASAYDPDSFSSVDQVVVMAEAVPDTPIDPVTDYESFIANGSADFEWPEIDEELPAGMCYTSGTTGRPKGVEYTHQMLWSHTLGELTPMGLDIDDSDVVMPVVPMFHANAWGIPVATSAAG